MAGNHFSTTNALRVLARDDLSSRLTKTVPIAPDSLSGLLEAQTESNQILGLFGGVRDGEQGHTTLTIENVPPHQSVELTVEVWVVDSWDGAMEAGFAPDLWQVRQGADQVLLRTAFSNIDSRAESQSYPLAYPEGTVAPRTNAIATHQLSEDHLPHGRSTQSPSAQTHVSGR